MLGARLISCCWAMVDVMTTPTSAFIHSLETIASPPCFHFQTFPKAADIFKLFLQVLVPLSMCIKSTLNPNLYHVTLDFSPPERMYRTCVDSSIWIICSAPFSAAWSHLLRLSLVATAVLVRLISRGAGSAGSGLIGLLSMTWISASTRHIG